jgi:triosephosphate isomerase
MHQSESGAFTGEISADMLQNIGEYCNFGHSERRAIFNETDALIASKVNTALEHDMTVIFCFGEELKDRQSANHFNVVENQLKDGLFNIQASDWGNVVLHMSQYGLEPVKLLLQNKHKKCINSSKQFVRHTETISQKKYPSFTEEV